MPKRVDHDERRSQIVGALIRLAGRDGLHAVTLRSVAVEAGTSLRLVQYYFGDKAQLMHAALLSLEEQSHRRWAARMAVLPEPPPLRDYLEAFVAEALPTDPESRTFHLVWTSYAVLAMTDPHLAAQPFVDGPNRLEGQLAATLRRGQAEGVLAADLDSAFEAARLLAVTHGLGTGVLVGQRTAEAAAAVLRGHLDRLFGDGTPGAG